MSYGFRRRIQDNIIRHQVRKPFRLEYAGDNIYVNIQIDANPEVTLTEADYTVTRTETIISNPSDYYVSIIRFDVPGLSIPLHIMPVEPNPADPTDVNYSQYVVSLEYDGNTETVHLNYVSDSIINSSNIVPPTSDTQQDLSPYYWIFNYRSFVEILNTALQTAFTNLPTKPAGSAAPYMLYNEESQLFSLICQQPYYEDSLPNPIKIFFNFKLALLFEGISFKSNSELFVFRPDKKDLRVKVIYRDNYYVPPNEIAPVDPLLQLSQQFKSFDNFNSFQKIFFTSTLLPIRSEVLPGTDNTQKIITDFDIPDQNSNTRSEIEYFANGVYRLVDLTSDSPLRQIDISCFWQDTRGNVYKILIPWNNTVTIKLGFFKKTLFNNSVEHH